MMNAARKNRMLGLLIMVLSLVLVVGIVAEPVQAASIKAPTKVTKVKIKSIGTTSMKVTWKKVSNAKGYHIYRKTAKSKWKKVGTVKGAGRLSFSSGQLKPNTKYYYKVRAYRTYKVKGKTKYKYGKFSKSVTATTKKSLTTITLKDGYYTAGIDIPAGTFDVTATAGAGYILSESDSANLRGPEYKRDDIWDFDSYSRTHNNYKLAKGEILEIKGVQIKCCYSKITVKASPRTYDKSAGIKLGPGHYKVGEDISPGIYCIQYVSGEGGFVDSDRTEGDCIVSSNIDGDPKTGEYTDYVSNIVLKKGETIQVTSGLVVLFIPEK